MSTVIVFFVLIITAYALSDIEQWIEFKNTYGKIYETSLEEQKRYEIFKSSLRKIREQNQKFQIGLSSHKCGVTSFADLTPKEFLGPYKFSKNIEPINLNILPHTKSLNDIPDEIDWREKGAVTEVRNQGTCGKSEAFSLTGTVEGAYFIHSGDLIPLSTANLQDCVDNNIEHDWREDALEYIKKNGVEDEADYPSDNCDGICKFNASKPVVKITKFSYVLSNSEEELKIAVAEYGPVSVLVDVTLSFQLYVAGILDDQGCRPDQLNHSVLVVGYGTLDGKDYWIAKNSWGPNWGMQGYILLARNKNNQCGVASRAIYTTI